MEYRKVVNVRKLQRVRVEEELLVGLVAWLKVIRLLTANAVQLIDPTKTEQHKNARKKASELNLKAMVRSVTRLLRQAWGKRREGKHMEVFIDRKRFPLLSP